MSKIVMEIKENPTSEDLLNEVNKIKKDIESGTIYSGGQIVGTIKIKGEVFNVTVGVESPYGLKFDW